MKIMFYSQDWEKKYVHQNWSQVLQENVTLDEVHNISVFILCVCVYSVL